MKEGTKLAPSCEQGLAGRLMPTRPYSSSLGDAEGCCNHGSGLHLGHSLQAAHRTLFSEVSSPSQLSSPSLREGVDFWPQGSQDMSNRKNKQGGVGQCFEQVKMGYSLHTKVTHHLPGNLSPECYLPPAKRLSLWSQPPAMPVLQRKQFGIKMATWVSVSCPCQFYLKNLVKKKKKI